MLHIPRNLIFVIAAALISLGCATEPPSGRPATIGERLTDRDAADVLPSPTTNSTWHEGQEFDDCSGAGWCPRMVVVAAGSFTMGSPPGETGRDERDEGPQRQVSVLQFAVGKFEVTFNEWDACVNRGGCPVDAGGDYYNWGRGTRPVIEVSWDDARTYVKWLSRETGRNYRLLSEAEWEYAARAGTKTAYSTGENISSSQANLNKTIGRTQPVGTYAANAFGLHDMHGNVWEWVQDCYAVSYSDLPTDAFDGGAHCAERVIRGGSWSGTPQNHRSANRVRNLPTYRGNTVGFRVARMPD